MEIILSAILILITLLLLLYHWSVRTYDHWKKKGVPFVRPSPFFGNLGDFIFRREHYHGYLHKVYKELDGEPFGGFFEMREPVLMIRDPKLFLTITVKDFGYFTDRDTEPFFRLDKRKNPLTENIFALKGQKWRDMRRKLSPVYTSGKLKSVMCEQIYSCIEWLMENLSKKGDEFEADCKKLFADFIIDVIAVCSFGLKISGEGEKDQARTKFAEMGERAFSSSQYNWRYMLQAINKKTLDYILTLDFPADVTEYFLGLIEETIKYRQRTNYKRNDFFQLMHEAITNQEDSDQEKYDNIDLAANAFMFFAAGLETTASALSVCVAELSQLPEVQWILRDEIDRTRKKYGGHLNADAVKEMTYFDMVISEALRKATPVTPSRLCVQDYRIPDTDVTIEAGTRVIIPTHSIHSDSKYFPNPEKFDPERFSEENIAKLIPGSFSPFGEGPRMCIGMRFANLTMRLVLAEILTNYEIVACSRTPFFDDYMKGLLIKLSAVGVWVKFKKL